MANSPFLKHHGKEKSRNRYKDKERNEKYKYTNRALGPAEHPYFNSFFKNKVGNEIIKLVKKYNNYPTLIDNKPICLDFYIWGKCNRDKACAYSSLYIFLLARSFRKLIIYSRGIFEQYDSVEKEKPKSKAPSGKKKDPKQLATK